MAASAFNATWQAMQHRGWTEEQLATLQRNWESVDFFTNLAETVAFTRVFLVTGMEQDRIRRRPGPAAWPGRSILQYGHTFARDRRDGSDTPATS